MSSKGDNLVLTYLFYFVVKTESVTNPISSSFLLKSLREFAGDLEEGTLLCPMRALRIYLLKTSSIPHRPKQLFVPLESRIGISKNAISYFLRKVILDAGASGSSEGPAPRAHSI